MKETHIIKQCAAKYLIRSGRGGGLMSQGTDLFRDVLDGTVYMFAIKGVFGIEISPVILFVIVVVKKAIEYAMGYFDEKIGFWKYENDYASREINPFNKELLDRVKNIESIIDNDDK